MLSRIITRRSAQTVIPTRRAKWGEWFMGAVAALAIACVTSVAARLDEISDASVISAAQAERKHMAMEPRVLQAYEQGMADAMASVKGKPEGLALAQACAAQRRGL